MKHAKKLGTPTRFYATPPPYSYVGFCMPSDSGLEAGYLTKVPFTARLDRFGVLDEQIGVEWYCCIVWIADTNISLISRWVYRYF